MCHETGTKRGLSEICSDGACGGMFPQIDPGDPVALSSCQNPLEKMGFCAGGSVMRQHDFPEGLIQGSDFPVLPLL